MPAVMNAANEAAVALFLDRRISYLDISRRIQLAMDRHSPVSLTIDAILDGRWLAAVRPRGRGLACGEIANPMLQ